MSIQFVVVKSEFCCNTKFVEGIIHERAKLPLVGEMFNEGAGVVCAVQIPPLKTVAANLFPSADDATEIQFVTGALFDTQVTPESIEV